jgi:hypothetical protein
MFDLWCLQLCQHRVHKALHITRHLIFANEEHGLDSDEFVR